MTNITSHSPSTSIESGNVGSESLSIQDLQNVEANDLSSSVNEEISITLPASPSPNPAPKTPKTASFALSETPKNSLLRRRLKRETSDENESELENKDVIRKPSRISYDERLTVICDDSAAMFSPSTSPSPTQVPASPAFDDIYKHKNFFEFFWEELTRGYSLHNDHARFSEKRRKVYAFLRIPWELEHFLLYGILQCIDAFLYLFTFLPLRFVMSIFGALLRIKRWTSAETCDVLKVVIIVCASLLIREIDSSVLYHQVRSQGVIKLYIFYNMLEVADRLFSSLGQDMIDALLWTANGDKFSARNCINILLHLAVTIGYATLHSFLVILQATTLNVAFNSHNQTVLAIMMSNNFVELKGSVFKKFAKANLFQMACSDVRERFHIFALLFVVMIRNMTAMNWSFESFSEMLPDLALVIGAEYLVDWLKHAFITKFNEINSEVYKDFTITIAFDVIRSREDSAFSDYSDQVSRRMGFIPIPLSIMIIRVLSQTFSIDNSASLCIFFIGWLLVFAIKICNGVIMLGMACQHVKKFRDFQARAEYELFRKRMVEKKSKSAPNSPRMSLIDFSDVLHQPAAGKGYAFSDILAHLEELQPSLFIESRRSTDRDQTNITSEQNPANIRVDDRTPRRTMSMANIPRRDRSEPPGTTDENCGTQSNAQNPTGSATKTNDESTSGTTSNAENSAQLSPKKKIDNEFADVTAYEIPGKGEPRIQI